jgi:hypothetical protein
VLRRADLVVVVLDGMPIDSSARIVSLRSSVAASSVVMREVAALVERLGAVSSLKRKYSSSGPTLNVSKPIDSIRSSARRRT